MNRKKWKTLGSYAALGTLSTIVGLVFAAHFNFYVSQEFSDEEAINEANVQNRAGALNLAKPKLSADTNDLVIQHQREHPADHNFAPVPDVTFNPQPYVDAAAHGRSGFAVVAFGESGNLLELNLLTAGGMSAPRSLAAAISGGLRTQFQDQRRHDHRAYFAYRIVGGTVQLAGRPIVTLPMCCQCGEAVCEEN